MMFLLALLFFGPPRAEDRPEAERLFQLGLELVAEGDTTGALAAWEGAAATGWASAALSYNRGTVTLARGDLGTARLSLERAARLAPRNATIAAALADARERSGDPAPSVAERTVQLILASLGLTGTIVLVLLLYALTLSIGLYWRRRRSRPLALATTASAIVFAAGLGLAMSGLVASSSPRGVVLNADIVRTAPSPTATEAARLPAGTAVQLGDTKGAWQAITVDNLDGWVPRSQVEAI